MKYISIPNVLFLCETMQLRLYIYTKRDVVDVPSSIPRENKESATGIDRILFNVSRDLFVTLILTRGSSLQLFWFLSPYRAQTAYLHSSSAHNTGHWGKPILEHNIAISNNLSPCIVILRSLKICRVSKQNTKITNRQNKG